MFYTGSIQGTIKLTGSGLVYNNRKAYKPIYFINFAGIPEIVS